MRRVTDGGDKDKKNQTSTSEISLVLARTFGLKFVFNSEHWTVVSGDKQYEDQGIWFYQCSMQYRHFRSPRILGSCKNAFVIRYPALMNCCFRIDAIKTTKLSWRNGSGGRIHNVLDNFNYATYALCFYGALILLLWGNENLLRRIFYITIANLGHKLLGSEKVFSFDGAITP